jgi:hypothetical protein
MSAAWDCSSEQPQDAVSQKRLIRVWFYLAVAGGFLLYVYSHLNISLF